MSVCPDSGAVLAWLDGDEPAAGAVDEAFERKRPWMSRLNMGEVACQLERKLREQGRSLLLFEQRIDLALRVCDRLYVLAGGEIALEDRAGSVDGEERALISAYLG